MSALSKEALKAEAVVETVQDEPKQQEIFSSKNGFDSKRYQNHHQYLMLFFVLRIVILASFVFTIKLYQKSLKQIKKAIAKQPQNVLPNGIPVKGP